MSDIGLIFPVWFFAGLALVFALPITTAILAGIGIAAYRIRRRDPSRRLIGVRWTAIIVAPFWLAGATVGALGLISEIQRENYGAQHYFTLDQAAEIDGVTLPAGTQVSLDESRALGSAELPDGATATLQGATWRGKIEFVPPGRAKHAAHGQINEGTLAAPAEFDGILCQDGREATFFWDGRLMHCGLARDSDIPATFAAPGQGPRTYRLRCLAGDTIQLDGRRQGELDNCRLAEPADFGDIVCAAGQRIQIGNKQLAACIFATAARFGPLTLPAGSFASYQDGKPSNFRLAPGASSVDGFGLSLPAGSEGAFCDQRETLQRLEVNRAAYVTIDGVKLTGFLDFDCKSGMLTDGLLFEDTRIGGSWRDRGARVSHDDLAAKRGSD
jgi:hypothetical protein